MDGGKPIYKKPILFFLSKVEKNVDAYVALIKNPEARKKLLENLSKSQPENSDSQSVPVDSKQYYERCLQIIESNCRKVWQSLECTEIEEIKRALSSEEFIADDAFLKKFGILITQYMSFITWTRPEELWQIMGTIAIKDQIFLMDSDFDVKINLAQRVRWLHMVVLEISKTEKSGESSGGVLSAPEEKFIRALFALHGVKYEDYLKQITESSL